MLTDILVEAICNNRIDIHRITRRATLMARAQKALNLPVAEKVPVKLERGDTVYVYR
jgi:hypothetical protein